MIRRNFILGAGAGFAAACAPVRGRVPATDAETSHPPLGRFYGPPGRRVHATDQGEGRPVVLIHGASGNLRDWTFSIAPLLAESYRVIAMDRPGFGYSDRQDHSNAWRPESQAMQLRVAALEMGVENPIIVGHSWGAAVALAWALDAPDQVAGVVSVSGMTMPWDGIAPFLDAIGVGPLLAGAYSRRMVRTAESGGAAQFIDRAFSPQTPPEGYFDYVGVPLALRPATVAANADDLAYAQRAVTALSARYAGLRVPVEVMHGGSDRLLDFTQHGLYFAASVPDASFLPLAQTGHMAHHVHPEALAELIGAIAARTPA
ncbi:MAG: alpha/beta fold hydrolase [Pikeienuella sp.]